MNGLEMTENILLTLLVASIDCFNYFGIPRYGMSLASALGGVRTRDLLIKSQLLYQLSYKGMCAEFFLRIGAIGRRLLPHDHLPITT